MTFSYLITAFFRNYLASELGLTPNSIASYSDCIKLLIRFASSYYEVEPEKLSLDNLNRDLIVAFLDHLEHERGNGAATRNQRLAVIKTFFRFLAINVPELMHLNETIQAIRQKKTEHVPPPSMTHDEISAMIGVVDTSRLLGVRDNALLQLMYNSGGRVQELADLRISDVRFEIPATVTLTGKGRKTRVVPLWQETVAAIKDYISCRNEHGIQSEHLFLSNRNSPLTRAGIARRVGTIAKHAARHCPSLRDRGITPHVFRHTIALHLLESGVDLVLVKEWLGHADLRTTSQYLEVSIERKRTALAKVSPPDEAASVERPQWKEPALMQFLTDLSRGVMSPKSR